MDTAITRAEHEEFRRRMEEEHRRLGKRLCAVEDGMDRLHALSASIERLAVNMESMVREQARQGRRLAALETRDGDKWRQVCGAALTAAAGGAVGYILRMMGM